MDEYLRKRPRVSAFKLWPIWSEESPVRAMVTRTLDDS
jgi:hypothetical protein